jgi:hypothetical protein
VRLISATDDFRFVPSVTLAASAPQRSLVEARASVTGGTPPYTYLWAGSNAEHFSFTGNSISYVPLVRDFRRILRTQSFERTENVAITVVDANGVSAQAGQALQVTAHPHSVPAGVLVNHVPCFVYAYLYPPPFGYQEISLSHAPHNSQPAPRVTTGLRTGAKTLK